VHLTVLAQAHEDRCHALAAQRAVSRSRGHRTSASEIRLAAGAALLLGNLGHDLVGMLAAAGPGDLVARVARDGTAHGSRSFCLV
jgi:hypothetical protein